MVKRFTSNVNRLFNLLGLFFPNNDLSSLYFLLNMMRISRKKKHSSPTHFSPFNQPQWYIVEINEFHEQLYIFGRIAAVASHLAYHNKRKTITSREIQTAIRISGELTKHAVSEGTKAVTKYTIAKKLSQCCLKSIILPLDLDLGL